ncbi:hypothetical protein FH972_024564 [Carpinus fangiana]|uniref:Pentatricopeptide repeat domain-containing protein n=1 Tax=Carpinus fangiana TaxID=176857 RepID=A0A5N6KYS3_9ROSI|nr:hypothetical protein FH972_024564 [Carpinus fangiana]
MARAGSGSVLSLITTPFRARGVGWVCPSCRDHRASKQQRQVHSDIDRTSNATRPPTFDPLLSSNNRGGRRQAQTQDADLEVAQPATAYPFQTFLARKQRDARGERKQNARQGRISKGSLEDIFGSLQLDDPVKLVDALADASSSSLRSIPRTTWSEIISALDPKGDVIAPIHTSHRAFTGRKNKAARALFQHTRSSYIELLSSFTDVCHRAGKHLQLEHYRQLLRYSANMGANNMARTLWHDMEEAGISPDLDCYNYRMEALLFNEGSRLLQTKGAKGIRSQDPEDDEPQVYTRVTLFKPGDSPHIKKLLKELETQGIKADTRIYCNVITALARDGDLNSVVKILSSVWHLDVRAVMAGEAISHVSNIEPSNPLYPNTRLITTIADAFGSHGRLTIAIRLTDLVSQHYNVPVKPNVWFRLLQWTALYARLANDDARRSGRSNSSLSRAARREQANHFLGDVNMLFQTMTNPPYNVRPTLDMLHLVQKNSLGQGLVGTPEFTMPADAGRLQYADAVAKFREEQYQLKNNLSAANSHLGRIVPAKKTSRLERRTRVSQMRKAIGKHYLTWWAHLIVQHSVPVSTELSPEEEEQIRDWQLRGIPNFVTSNRAFMPSTFQYQTPGGMVRLLFRTGEDIEEGLRRKGPASQRRRMKLVNLKNVKRPWDTRPGGWTGRSKGLPRRVRVAPAVIASV